MPSFDITIQCRHVCLAETTIQVEAMNKEDAETLAMAHVQESMDVDWTELGIIDGEYFVVHPEDEE